jgi:hypothetical protein
MAVEERRSAPTPRQPPRRREHPVDHCGAMADHPQRLTPARSTVRAMHALAAALNVPACQRGRPCRRTGRWIETIAADLGQAASSGRVRPLVVSGRPQAAVRGAPSADKAALGPPRALIDLTPTRSRCCRGMKPGSRFASPATRRRHLRARRRRSAGGGHLIIIGGNPPTPARGHRLRRPVARLLSRERSATRQRQGRDGCAHPERTWPLTTTRLLAGAGGTSRTRTSSSRATPALLRRTASIIQPLIAPLCNSRSPVELMAALLGESRSPGRGHPPLLAGQPPRRAAGRRLPGVLGTVAQGRVIRGRPARVVVAPQQNLQVAPPAPPRRRFARKSSSARSQLWDGGSSPATRLARNCPSR